ncbi:gamma-glutamylcyclotransferase family protein [Sinisalibacter aestuarii]|uniref:Gamma-glutamylcyclotransferase n=1 Tax=Sinisalibacter aestuarii TaxID=2949426 RepID=A0ABQ5LVK1_9RHOB|nr:gamma-glutamylcyclotransferase family protein [Sinisalibacter aestuarii]GKY88405.1 gamma-glutamylcyclotransferase [Sinisalibacter aestuarii]
MQDPFFFGYGSLVNRRTHHYAEAAPARVRGWRRAWRKSPLRQRCFLTVLPAPGVEIEGLVAAVPGADWAALDEREHAYARHDVSGRVTHAVGREIDVALYAIPEGAHHDPGPEHPVLLSYIDVVVQGFLAEFGEAGVRRFFETTEGWHVPVLDDRAQPVYARHQPLDRHERALVEDELARIGARVVRG